MIIDLSIMLIVKNNT